jgi:hypothetical protein
MSQFQIFLAPSTRGRFQEAAGRNRTSEMGSLPEGQIFFSEGSFLPFGLW